MEKWKNAQKLELEFWKQWLDGRFEWLGGYKRAMSTLNSAMQKKSFRSENRDLTFLEFFKSNQYEFENFCTNMTDRTCMEIGSACEGQVAFWYWVKKRIVIEPLILLYRDIVSDFGRGKTWLTDGPDYRTCPGEVLQEDLIDKIDGAIVCRNCLDHSGDPWGILNNISKYASTGCHLLLWTEISHHVVDGGHFDWDATPESMESFLTGNGWTIRWNVGAIHGPGHVPGVEYGCVAVRC